VARVLIVGGGCRGRRLAAEIVEEGHAARVTTRTHAGRAAIEATGAESFLGTPDRVGTLLAALENVTIVCWLLATATGAEGDVRALHAARLRAFLDHAIDTTMRAFIYEACGPTVPREVLAEGRRIVEDVAAQNAIPAFFLTADPRDASAWRADARAAVDRLLAGA
jgi:hypothetical protein